MKTFLVEAAGPPEQGTRVRPRAEVIVLRGAMVLVGKNHRGGYRGKYMIPGGGIGPAEDPAAAARRECREEIAALCEIEKQLGDKKYDWPDIYGGRNPSSLVDGHREWLEKEGLKGERTYTFLATYTGKSKGDGGPADDKYDQDLITLGEFRKWIESQEDSEPWMLARKTDLLSYVAEIEEAGKAAKDKAREAAKGDET